MRNIYTYVIGAFITVLSVQMMAQISPGKLSEPHAYLEGIANCTKCHVIGEKETTSKCLECHKEIQRLQSKNQGYHASSEVKGKKCASCHGEHLGFDFQLVKFDQETFDHSLTGYELMGKHKKLECNQCHKESLIKEKTSQKKKGSFLDLGTDCLSCHEDFHQKSLSKDCLSCHNQDKFRPATKFNHAKTKYPLEGKHATIDCEKCHRIEIRNGKKFQQFAGIEFNNCTNCHKDVHENKFGNDCKKCHNILSFREIRTLINFDHDRTDYPLKGAHRSVDCKKCHLSSYTTPIKYVKCIDCHKDYHDGQFKKENGLQDCIDCHTNIKFSPATYTIEKHNKSQFILEGAHLAVPCFECHKKSDKWNFKIGGQKCTDCHDNIHKNYISTKYIPNEDCKVCHVTFNWSEISFDHNKTEFSLKGKHININCKSCHFKELDGVIRQQFQWTTKACTNCHQDIHYNQFDVEGYTSCDRCHTSNDWKPVLFNHNQARFKLDGKHRNLDCRLCHKINNESDHAYRIYKFKDISCASCH